MIQFGYSNKAVCITGGASGIGRAAALILAGEGASVGLIDRDEAALAKVSKEIVERGGRASSAAMDVRDPAATRAAADRFESELGEIEGLIACAGISGSDPAESIPLQEWEQVMSVNVTGLFVGCQVFGRRMIARGRGSIVLIGSVDGLGGHPSRTHYTASKHAVHGITKSLALEWGRHGLRVNAVAPNLVDTPLLRRNMPPNFVKNVVEDRTPLGRMAQAEEVATAALMLLSDASSYVSGVILPVDGGLTAGPFTRKQGGDYSSRKLLEAGVYEE